MLQEVGTHRRMVVVLANRPSQKLCRIILPLIMSVNLYLIFHLLDTKNAINIFHKYN